MEFYRCFCLILPENLTLEIYSGRTFPGTIVLDANTNDPYIETDSKSICNFFGTVGGQIDINYISGGRFTFSEPYYPKFPAFYDDGIIEENEEEEENIDVQGGNVVGDDHEEISIDGAPETEDYLDDDDRD